MVGGAAKVDPLSTGAAAPFLRGSLSIVGVGFVKIPPQFYEKGPFYV